MVTQTTRNTLAHKKYSINIDKKKLKFRKFTVFKDFWAEKATRIDD